MAASGQIAFPLLFAVTAVSLCAQTAPPASGNPAAKSLVRDVVYNELQDRERDSHWEYLDQKVTPDKNVVREQVETDRGPVFQIVERNGAPLDSTQREQEAQRVDAYIHDSAEVARVAKSHQEDEDRIARVLQVLPDALLFEFQGSPANEVAVLTFSPNPAYVPSTYEARLIHTLQGTVTVNVRWKRMVAMRGRVAERVDFGYGLLGHVEPGGTFEIHRRQVSEAHWKTDLVELHLQGKILLLKTLNKDQRETRTDFRPVPGGTTLEEAKQMLDQAAGQTAQAEFRPAALQTGRTPGNR
jgi:hypothetical protein